ncbi:hypothetical protein F4604DRAFT_1691069 [Suillus subluteus]|nr:hypothetical protein F4604DRAFT_1691069 [Suillus subluteus]
MFQGAKRPRQGDPVMMYRGTCIIDERDHVLSHVAEVVVSIEILPESCKTELGARPEVWLGEGGAFAREGTQDRDRTELYGVVSRAVGVEQTVWLDLVLVRDKEQCDCDKQSHCLVRAAPGLSVRRVATFNERSSRNRSENVKLQLKQKFEGREPEMQFFAALRAAFYKKRTEKSGQSACCTLFYRKILGFYGWLRAPAAEFYMDRAGGCTSSFSPYN